jgi:intein-encoded DNA endonuclease-like protein
MKKGFASVKNDCEEIKVSGLRKFIEKQKEKLKSGQLKCPLCKRMFTGMSAVLAHLKDHCT